MYVVRCFAPVAAALVLAIAGCSSSSDGAPSTTTPATAPAPASPTTPRSSSAAPPNTTGKPLCRTEVGKRTVEVIASREPSNSPDSIRCALAPDPAANTPQLTFLQCPGSPTANLAMFDNEIYTAPGSDEGEYFGRLDGTLMRFEPDGHRPIEDIFRVVC